MLKRSIMPRRRFWAVGHAAAFVLTFLALNAVGADDCLSLHDDDVRELVEDGPLTVHLVPHTHDDVGWLKTPDQYLWGANNTIQVADVSLILDAVTRELARDPMRTFVYGEVFFLSHWWRQQDRSTHDLVRSLVGSGQLQLVNGGWVQHDEATAAFPDMLDQTARGHAFLKAALDVSDARCIVGWQIDPFGHSAAHVDLLTRLHAPGLFFGRMHHEELNARRRAGELEFRWDPFGNGEGGVLTRASWSGNYGPPPSFNFETFVGDEPVMDDPSEVACNAARRAWEFVRAAQDIAEFYSPRQSEGGVGDEMRHVMVEMGTDFTYMGAGAWFRNMDRLRAHVERLFPGSIRVVYSTPLSYLTAKYGSQALGIDDASCPQAPWMGRQRSGSAGGGEVPAAASRRLAMDVGAVGRQQGALAAISGAWGRAYGSVSIGDVPVRGGDFFPYADNPHAYWIGYFTSRPAHKYLARHASNVLRAARAMAALCGPRCGDSRDFLDPLESAVSTMQHHDAITGTAKQHVADDYARRLHGGVQATLKLAQEYLGGSWQLCPLANASYCMETMDVEAFEMASFNSLGWSAASWVTLPVSADTFDVVDAESGEPIEGVGFLPAWHMDKAAWAANCAALGHGQDGAVPGCAQVPKFTMHVPVQAEPMRSSRVSASRTREAPPAFSTVDAATCTRTSPCVLAEDEDTGARVTWAGIKGGLRIRGAVGEDEVSLIPEVNFYESFYTPDPLGPDKYENQKSGAYVFRPQRANGLPASASGAGGPVTEIVASGAVREVRLFFSEWATLTLRTTSLPGSDPRVTLTWQVGAIPVDDGVGREVVVGLRTSVASGGEWYSDANGRALVRRERRDSPAAVEMEPVASRFAPITAAACVRDEQHALCALTDRAQAASSQSDGQLEVMVHRRVLHDDDRGVAEPLDEDMCGGVPRDAQEGHAGPRRGDGCPAQVVRGSFEILVMRARDFAPAQVLRRALMHATPPTTYVAPGSAALAQPPRPLATGRDLPDGVHLLSVEPAAGNSVLVRLMDLRVPVVGAAREDDGSPGSRRRARRRLSLDAMADLLGMDGAAVVRTGITVLSGGGQGGLSDGEEEAGPWGPCGGSWGCSIDVGRGAIVALTFSVDRD